MFFYIFLLFSYLICGAGVPRRNQQKSQKNSPHETWQLERGNNNNTHSHTHTLSLAHTRLAKFLLNLVESRNSKTTEKIKSHRCTLHFCGLKRAQVRQVHERTFSTFGRSKRKVTHFTTTTTTTKNASTCV